MRIYGLMTQKQPVLPRSFIRRFTTGLGAALGLGISIGLGIWPGLSAARAVQAAETTPAAPLVQLEILDGGLTSRGTYMGALRLTLSDGWKTYWRAPGDAGIPPSFSWQGSRNLGAVAMTWPTPEVFMSAGYRTIGYHNQLILPIEITPERPGKPIRLKGQMELGVCKDVCVPSELSFDHRLDLDAARNPAIVAALASRPYSASEAGVTSAVCRVTPGRYGLEVEARIHMPSAGGAEIAVIEPGTPHLMAGETRSERKGQTLIASTEFLPVTKGSAAVIDRSSLRITVLGQNHAVDILGCEAG